MPISMPFRVPVILHPYYIAKSRSCHPAAIVSRVSDTCPRFFSFKRTDWIVPVQEFRYSSFIFAANLEALRALSFFTARVNCSGMRLPVCRSSGIGNMCMDEKAHFSIKARVCLNSASLSPGKPTIRSAVIPQSGKCSLSRQRAS